MGSFEEGVEGGLVVRAEIEVEIDGKTAGEEELEVAGYCWWVSVSVEDLRELVMLVSAAAMDKS
jgi:hypothetical protein